jgi:hypothetical protein
MQQTNISIDEIPVLEQDWNFSSTTNIEDWISSTPYNQSFAKCAMNENGTYLEAYMQNSTSGWITVNSPILPAANESRYTINVNFTSPNISELDFKIAEFDGNMKLVSNITLAQFGNQNDQGTFPIRFSDQYTFEPHNDTTRYIQIQFWDFLNTTISSNCTLLLSEVGVHGVVYSLNTAGIESLYPVDKGNLITPVISVKSESPTKIVVAVNSTQPFILTTTQVLDRYWVANVNHQQIQSIPLYLGLKGFLINQTGQFDVTIEYKPQQWLNYTLIISGATVLFLCICIVYLQRTYVRGIYRKIRSAKR